MNLLKWIGLMPVGEHHKLMQDYSALKREHDSRLDELVATREQLDRARKRLDVVATSRAEVAEMLKHAMDQVTNAVGLAKVLDAAKLKLESDSGAERPVGVEDSGASVTATGKFETEGVRRRPEDILSISVDPQDGRSS